jgi:hypothetical protein
MTEEAGETSWDEVRTQKGNKILRKRKQTRPRKTKRTMIWLSKTQTDTQHTASLPAAALKRMQTDSDGARQHAFKGNTRFVVGSAKHRSTATCLTDFALKKDADTQ